MFVILDLFIWPLAVRFCPGMRSRGNSSFFGLSDFALGCVGSCSLRDSGPCALSCVGESSETEEPCSWLDRGDTSGLFASRRLFCETSLDDSWKNGESESREEGVSWVFVGSGCAQDRGVMDPDEVAWAVSAGCTMACCMSWTLAGSVRVEAGAGCMVFMETGMSLAHGRRGGSPDVGYDRARCRVARRRGSHNARLRLGSNGQARDQLTASCQRLADNQKQAPASKCYMHQTLGGMQRRVVSKGGKIQPPCMPPYHQHRLTSRTRKRGLDLPRHSLCGQARINKSRVYSMAFLF
jgi:hypothetical protein